MFKLKSILLFNLALLFLAGVIASGLNSNLISAQDTEIDLRVMSYNIHFGNTIEDVYNIEDIAKAITKENPDVVALQEVDVNWGKRSNYEDTLAKLSKLTGMESFYSYIYDKPSQRGKDYPNEQFGVAFLSKYPIKYAKNHEITRWSTQPGDPQPGDPNFPGKKPGFAEIVIEVESNDVSIYNTHLDYRPEPPVGYNKTIREIQVQDMLKIMSTTKNPCILMGDMNAETSAKDVFDPLLANFNDAWALKGKGNGFTFSTEKPHVRIDYVLTSKNSINVNNAFVSSDKSSDHFPLIADLTIKY